MVGRLICQCRDRNNIQDGIELPLELPLEFIPPSPPDLPCLLLLGFYLQLQKGMFLEENIIPSQPGIFQNHL